MKRNQVLVLITIILAFAMIACAIDLGEIGDDIADVVSDFDAIKSTVEAVAKEFEGFPIPEDITNFKVSGNSFSFDTSISVDELIDYYVEKMGGLGLVQLGTEQIEGEEFTYTFGGSEGQKQVQLKLFVINENQVHVEVTLE